MTSGQLVWAGDHFAPAELAQLRDDREQKALAWLDAKLAGESGDTKAALVVLVVPVEAFAAGVLLNLDRVTHIDPPLGDRVGSGGTLAEGRYFTSYSRPGRALVLRNGLVEGVSWLNVITDGNQRVDLGAMHSATEDNVRAYLDMQQKDLGLSGEAWLALSLGHASGLGALYRPDPRSAAQQKENTKVATDRVALPELLVNVSQGAQAVEDAVRRLFIALHGAFGL